MAQLHRVRHLVPVHVRGDAGAEGDAGEEAYIGKDAREQRSEGRIVLVVD